MTGEMRRGTQGEGQSVSLVQGTLGWSGGLGSRVVEPRAPPGLCPGVPLPVSSGVDAPFQPELSIYVHVPLTQNQTPETNRET